MTSGWQGLGIALLSTALLSIVLHKPSASEPVSSTAEPASAAEPGAAFLNIAKASPAYVGSKSCQSCHQEAYKLWQESDHYRSMAPAKQGSVLGDFADARVEFHGITSRFYESAGKYFVETLGSAGRSQFEISYTFGHYPLQQYLVATEDGRFQALNIAWDSRRSAEGGQRWFHLQPAQTISADSPFFWTRHLQNWNSRCADCHSTNLVKSYDPETYRYTTSFSEANVACEACHGPGSEHIETARRGQDTIGTISNARRQMSWDFMPGDAIAEGSGEVSATQVNLCGGCHSRRVQLGVTGTDYHDQFRLALLDEGLYHTDGQMEAEVFVLGSFLQSKMHAAGVTCTDCHEPHSGRLLLAGNSLCAQCHRPEVFDTSRHHLHQFGSAGGQCVACHMPSKTYMQVDDRREHRFGIPDPALTLVSGVPNACAGCHAGAPPDWAMTALGQGVASADLYARLNRQLQRYDPSILPALLSYVRDPANPAIKRATLVSYLSNLTSSHTIQLAHEMTSSDEPLIRAAAIRSVSHAAPGVRLAIIKKLAADPVKTVRIEAGRLMSEMLPDDFVETPSIHTLLQEYRDSLRFTRDTPSGQTELGLLELNLGRHSQAFDAYRRALAIEPQYVPALLNLADLHRARKEEDAAAALLQHAVILAPDAGATNYSYGLSLVRQKQTEAALSYFEAANLAQDSQPGYTYVYAIALDAESRTADAVQVLREASLRWAPQYELLKLEILYLEKTKRFDEVPLPLAELSKIAPDSPEVRAWMKQYRASE